MFEQTLKKERGFVIKKMESDGACLFRAIGECWACYPLTQLSPNCAQQRTRRGGMTRLITRRIHMVVFSELLKIKGEFSSPANLQCNGSTKMTAVCTAFGGKCGADLLFGH